MTLRKVGTTMMNENVKKAYEKLIDIRNILRYAKEKDKPLIDECMMQLFGSVEPLLEEKQYAIFAKSLQQHVLSYCGGKVDKEFVLEYTSKLIEMIEDGNKPAYSEEIKQMYEDARTAFEEVSSTVQEGFNATKERVKDEGPKYVAKAEKKAKKTAQKFVEGFQKWMYEDEQEESEESRDE